MLYNDMLLSQTMGTDGDEPDPWNETEEIKDTDGEDAAANESGGEADEEEEEETM